MPPQQAELIASHVAALQRLDDRYGGGALSLRYVSAELRSVIDLAEYANYEPQVGKQLLTIVAAYERTHATQRQPQRLPDRRVA